MLDLIIAGILQGILEWLPVSSEGIVSLFLQNNGYTLSQSVDIALFLHLGTLFATISFFWNDIKKITKPKTTNQVNMLSFLLMTTFISLVVAGPLYLIIQVVSESFADKVGIIIKCTNY